MATKKGGIRDIVPFWFALFATVFVLVACGDDASPTEAETPDSSSAAPEGGDFSTAFSSSSYYYWGIS